MISIIDTLLIVAYILAMMIMGWYLGKGNETQEDYLLAGRSMPWLPIGLSIAATMISANGFIGAPGWAYTDGIKPYMVNIGVPLAILIVMSTTAPVLYNLRITSVYEYVEKRFGVYTRILTVLGFIINSIIQISSMVLIPSLILKTFTGWSLLVVVPIVVVTSIIYTLLGGIKAVIWTDAIQMVVMWFGVIISIYIMLHKMDLSLFDTLSIARENGSLNALDFSFDLTATNGFYATLIGGTFMWIRYFGFDQGQVQRVLTAKSMTGVKNSFLLSALVMNGIYFLFMIVGVMLSIFYKGRVFESSNIIMVEFIKNELPIGVIGLVISGVFAAAMSSIDSLLNSLSTVYIKDIHERFFKTGSDVTSLKSAMIISSVWGVIIIFVTLMAFSGTTKSVLDVVGSYISNISGPMCGAFILGMFTKRANDKGTALSIIISFISVVFIGNIFAISWIWKPAIGTLICVMLGYLSSFIVKSDKSIDYNHGYTVFGQRESILKDKNIEVDRIPLRMDKYSVLIIGLFLFQYLALWALMK